MLTFVCSLATVCHFSLILENGHREVGRNVRHGHAEMLLDCAQRLDEQLSSRGRVPLARLTSVSLNHFAQPPRLTSVVLWQLAPLLLH